MRERKLNKRRLILIIILIFAALFYLWKFILPLFDKGEKTEGEKLFHGEFYTAGTRDFRQNFEGEKCVLSIDGAKISVSSGSAYSKNSKQALIYTASEKGVSYTLDYGNENFSVSGKFSGNIDAVSIMFTLTSASGKGFCGETQAIDKFFIEFHS